MQGSLWDRFLYKGQKPAAKYPAASCKVYNAAVWGIAYRSQIPSSKLWGMA